MRAMALRVASPILVGRKNELEVLQSVLDGTCAGRPATVLVSGEAGIGKTRLVREFSERARASGAIVLAGGSVRLGRDDGLPYAPVVEALRGLLRDRGAAAVHAHLDASTAELASLIPELGVLGRDVVPEDQRADWALTRLFEAVLILLRRLGEEGPAVFIVEDLHWADRSTRDLVAFLVRAMADERVMLIGTYRSDELHRRHPLLVWIGELDRAGVRRIDLQGLADDELQAQIEAITGERPAAAVVEVVGKRSGGNPFFVEELIAAGRPEERLPVSLRELLLARVGGLSAETQELLGVAAVSGPSVDHEVLCDVAGIDERTLSASLREAVAQHLLVPTSDAGRSLYTFRHALLQEAIYDDLLPRDRRLMHSLYAGALGRVPLAGGAAGASQLAAIAHHAEAAHELAMALDAWLRAARAAMPSHAVGEAAHAYSRCLELWDVVSAEQRPAGVDLIDILYEATFALSGTGDVDMARDMAQRSVDMADSDDPERLVRLLVRLGRTQWLAGDLVTATSTLEQAVSLVGDGPATATKARALAGMAGLLMLRGQTRRAIDIGQRALQLAEDAMAPGVTCFALNTLGPSLADAGRCPEGVDVARRGMAMAMERDRADDLHRAYANLATALQICGRLDEAERVAREGMEWARRRGMWRMQGAFLASTAASILLEQGRWPEATKLLEIEDVQDLKGVAHLHLAMTAGLIAVRSGRLDDAHRYLDDSRATLARFRDAQFTGPIYRGSGELAIAESRFAEVQSLVDEGLELMSETDDLRNRAALLALGVMAAAAAAARAARRRRPHQGPSTTLVDRRLGQMRSLIADGMDVSAVEVAHARASLAEAEGERLVLLGEPSADVWADAARRWLALGQVYPAAWCRACEAEALLASGARAAGEAALQEARRAARMMGAQPLLDRVEGLATLARVRLDGSLDAGDAASSSSSRVRPGKPRVGRKTPATQRRPFSLTERERQVLPLLAAGYTNRQIAQALFVSESTAGVHVSHIIDKMGVSNRVEAAALAVRSGLTG
jgi:DNA-binding CsgD family transcriptional regulator/tetratricopeptide (TPR) repeat protein